MYLVLKPKFLAALFAPSRVLAKAVGSQLSSNTTKPIFLTSDTPFCTTSSKENEKIDNSISPLTTLKFLPIMFSTLQTYGLGNDKASEVYPDSCNSHLNPFAAPKIAPLQRSET